MNNFANKSIFAKQTHVRITYGHIGVTSTCFNRNKAGLIKLLTMRTKSLTVFQAF